MGISVHLLGIRKKDGKWDQMAKIKTMCEEAGVELPKEVREYFKYPDDSLESNWEEMQEVGFSGRFGEKGEEWSDDYRQGFRIKVSDIPDDVEWIVGCISA